MESRETIGKVMLHGRRKKEISTDHKGEQSGEQMKEPNLESVGCSGKRQCRM